MLPKISIITPSFNQGHFIEQTVQSVLQQGYPNLEYFIIDGGSTDNTIDIIKKYESQVTYWVSEKDKGQSDAINKGFRMATGDVINWLNSDDYYEPGALNKVGEAFKDPTINAFLGRSRVFGKGADRFSPGTDVYKSNLPKTIGRARIDQPETFFRKAVWDDLGGLDKELHYIMDKEFWIRYLYKYGIDHLQRTEDILVHFRIHDNSKTGSQQEKFFKENIDLHYSYAKQFGVNEITDVLLKQFNATSLETTYSIEPAKKILVHQSLHYFLYFLCNELYLINDFAAARSVLPVINATMLNIEDKKELQKIAARMRWLSPALKKMYNRMFH